MDPSFATDCLLHVAILFSVLTLFFKFVVSRTATAAFQSSFRDLVDRNLGSNATMKKVMGSAVGRRVARSKNVKALEASLEGPDPAVAEHNWGVFATAFLASAGLAGMTMCVVLGAQGQVPIGELLRHNAATFACVGVVEYVFFRYVISRYEPAPPSTMVTSAIRSAQASLAPS